MDNLEPITRNEMFLNGDDLEPITREEMILAGADLEPITRHEWFLKKYRGGGGGGEYDLVNIPNLPADIASFNDGTDLPMASLKVAVTPYQDLSHGDPSPSNICPIIGWDEAVVTRTGVNVWDEESEDGYYDISNNGVKVSSSSWKRSKNFIPCIPEANYYFMTAYTGSDSFGALIFYDANGNMVSYKTSGSIKNSVFATPQNCRYIGFYAKPAWFNANLSINSTSTDHEYHAYNGNTYTIDLDGTRYGGTLDVTTGVLTVDRAYVDLGTLSWSYNNIQNFFFANLDDIKLTTKNLICDRYIYVEKAWATMQNGEFGKVENSNQIRFHNDNYKTSADFKTAMSGVQFVYELATPITVQLAPTQVKSLEGTNNIFADCGQITEVKYFKKA